MGVNFKCGVQSKRKCESHESCVCIAGFSACGCQKKSVVPEVAGVVIPDCNRGTFPSRPVYAQISIRCAALGLIKTTLTPHCVQNIGFS